MILSERVPIFSLKRAGSKVGIMKYYDHLLIELNNVFIYIYMNYQIWKVGDKVGKAMPPYSNQMHVQNWYRYPYL